jgi:hypothetical protein
MIWESRDIVTVVECIQEDIDVSIYYAINPVNLRLCKIKEYLLNKMKI